MDPVCLSTVFNRRYSCYNFVCYVIVTKKKPFFASIYLLMVQNSDIKLIVHLSYRRTLSGVSPAISPMAESLQVLSPVAITTPNFYPETWIPMDSSQEFTQVPMPKEDKSYRTVYTLFHKTVPETKFRIMKIMRVQNLFLWEKYKRYYFYSITNRMLALQIDQ